MLIVNQDFGCYTANPAVNLDSNTAGAGNFLPLVVFHEATELLQTPHLHVEYIVDYLLVTVGYNLPQHGYKDCCYQLKIQWKDFAGNARNLVIL